MTQLDVQAVKPTATRTVLIALATVVTMAITGSLGFWQLSRAAEKQALEDLIDARANLPALTNRDVATGGQGADGFYRPIRLSGEWVAAATVFLDNRPMGGRSGFIVVTPLRLEGEDREILVQRGWVPRNFTDRTQIPAIPTPSGAVERATVCMASWLSETGLPRGMHKGRPMMAPALVSSIAVAKRPRALTPQQASYASAVPGRRC